MPQGVKYFLSYRSVSKAETDGDSIIHHSHLAFIQSAHVLSQPPLVDGTNLFQQDHRIFAQAHTASGDIDVGGKPGLAGLASDGCGDDRGRMAVSRIVLNDEHRPGATLLAAHHR